MYNYDRPYWSTTHYGTTRFHNDHLEAYDSALVFLLILFLLQPSAGSAFAAEGSALHRTENLIIYELSICLLTIVRPIHETEAWLTAERVVIRYVLTDDMGTRPFGL